MLASPVMTSDILWPTVPIKRVRASAIAGGLDYIPSGKVKRVESKKKGSGHALPDSSSGEPDLYEFHGQ
jgi:hypothetical protein